MKLQAIFLMLALFCAATSAAMLLNTVEARLNSTGTEYTLNPNFTTVTQNGSDNTFQVWSDDPASSQQILVSYVNSTGTKKQATITLNGTTPVSSLRNKVYTLSNGATGLSFEVNLSDSTWNVTGASSTNFVYRINKSGNNQTINFTAVGLSNYPFTQWNLTGGASCANFSNVINVTSAEGYAESTTVQLTSESTLSSTLTNYNDSLGLHLVGDPTIKTINTTADTQWGKVYFSPDGTTIEFVNASGTYYQQGLLINRSKNLTTCLNSSLKTNLTTTTLMVRPNFTQSGSRSICGPSNLAYFPNVYRVVSTGANWTWNKTALSTSNPNNTNVSGVLYVVGETLLNNVTFKGPSVITEINWLNGTTPMNITGTSITSCANATVFNTGSSSTFQFSRFTQAGGFENYSDVAYVYAAKLFTTGVGNVTVNGTDGRLLYQIFAGDTYEPQGFYVCPELTGCNADTMIVSGDGSARYRAKLWSPTNSSTIVASFYNLLGMSFALSENYKIRFPMGSRLELYGKGYSANINTSAIFEVH